MKTFLNLEYAAEDVARLILADMIRKNPVLAKLTNEQYDKTWEELLTQTTSCCIALPPIIHVESGYSIRVNKDENETN